MRRDLLALAAFGMVAGTPEFAAAAGPQGQLTWGVHTTLAPTWFDPAETPGIITPWMVLYALHDALVKPMPGNPLTPSLAESFSAAEDALTYDFVLRPGVKFHNGEPVTAEDVKFSFERYRGSSAKMIKDGVAAVETPDARHIRFRLKEPWPDFLTFYGSATGAGWIVPKKYVEKVGEEGFKKSPVGAGPYKFASFTPGIELVFEAFDQYWRKPPSVKRLIFKVIPDETTRLAALKRGEVDIVYSVRGELAEELQRTPGLTLKPAVIQGVFNIYFPDQWDPKSPWHDKRVRQAASYAIDRKALSEVETLGASRPAGNFVPRRFEFALPLEPDPYDPAKARQLLAEAGYPNGFDAGELHQLPPYFSLGEAIVNYMQTVGIRLKMRPMERAAYFSALATKKLKGVCVCTSAFYGNAASRMSEVIPSDGSYAYGGYPDIDALYKQQALETDRRKREAALHQIQRLVHERVRLAPIYEYIWPSGIGPRVAEPALLLIDPYPWSAPLEEVRLKPASR